MGTKIVKKSAGNGNGGGRGGNPISNGNGAARKVKLLKPGQQQVTKVVVTGGNKPKPSKAILKNIQSYVQKNVVKSGRSAPVPAPSAVAAPRPKAISRVGVPTKTGGIVNYAVQTAAAIASNPAHPRSKDVRELLNTFEKGWIDENKFKQLLQGMVV